MSNIITLDDQVKDFKDKKLLKTFIKEKYEHYRSSPQGCVDYIQECLTVAKPGIGYTPFELWNTQRDMIYDIVENMFNPRKDMYILLGSRQCGKTTCMCAISDWVTTFYEKYNVVFIHIDDFRGAKQCGEFRTLRNMKSKFMYIPTKKNALTHQIFKNESSFMLQPTQKTSKSSDSGRGLSVNLLWIDEAGGVDIDKLESSIFPTTSTTFLFCKEANIPHIILLSGTANGRFGIGKRFYDLWKKVEPPKNKTHPSMGGYLLYWKNIPLKDDAWFASQVELLGVRKANQEIECVFYGAENALFTDEQIIKLQALSKQVSIIDPNSTFICPNTSYIAKGTFFSKPKKNEEYIIGIDVAKGRGSDYTVIEMLNYNTGEQIFEFADNNIQHDDFVHYVNNLVINLLAIQCRIVVSIESNMTGSAVISDLLSLNPIFKNLIYRDTIGADVAKKNQEKFVLYSDCRHGVEITENTRDLLINNVFKFVNNQLDCIKSKYLLDEIESLQMDKDGKISGSPHDDSVFALGHALLIKTRGRKQNVLSIFDYCDTIQKDNNFIDILDSMLDDYKDGKIIEKWSSRENEQNVIYSDVSVMNLMEAHQGYNNQNKQPLIMAPITNLPMGTDISKVLMEARQTIISQSEELIHPTFNNGYNNSRDDLIHTTVLGEEMTIGSRSSHFKSKQNQKKIEERKKLNNIDDVFLEQTKGSTEADSAEECFNLVFG